MSACRRYRHLLIDHLDGTLAPEPAERLRAHLDRCPACAEALEALARTRDLVRSLPAVEPPPWLEDRILVRAHTGQAPRRAARPWWRTSALSAAALVMLCLTGYLVWRNPRVPAARPSPAPAEDAAPAPALGAGPAPSPGVGAGAAPSPGATAKARPPVPVQPPASPAGTPAPAVPPPGRDLQVMAEAAAGGPPAADQARAKAARRPAALEAGAPPAASMPGQGPLALSLDPRDPIRAASQVQAAFAAVGATILARPGPDYRGITARVPGPALDALLERLEALGELQDAPHRPTRRQGEVMVTMTW